MAVASRVKACATSGDPITPGIDAEQGVERVRLENPPASLSVEETSPAGIPLKIAFSCRATNRKRCRIRRLAGDGAVRRGC